MDNLAVMLTAKPAPLEQTKLLIREPKVAMENGGADADSDICPVDDITSSSWKDSLDMADCWAMLLFGNGEISA